MTREEEQALIEEHIRTKGVLHAPLRAATKRCCTCKQGKPVTEFYKSSYKQDGYQDECIDCQYARRGLKRGTRGELDPNTVRGFQSDTDAAYAAGFFDGEGHVNFRKNRNKNGKIYTMLHVNIGQTSFPVLDWLKEYFGGSIYQYDAGTGTEGSKRTKTFWQWSIVGTRAKLFLKQIRPFLKVKHDQVDERLSVWENRNAGK
jgi:hypothetical protein